MTTDLLATTARHTARPTPTDAGLAASATTANKTTRSLRTKALGLIAAAVLAGWGATAATATTAAASAAQPNAFTLGQLTAAQGGGPAAPRAQLIRLARTAVDAGLPSVIVRVSDGRGPAVEFTEQASWTRKDHRLKAGDEFRMGSNTKTMVATLVLQLVAERKLALTDPVATWLPGLVPNGEAITLRMLLNHTSGLYDYTEDPAVQEAIIGQDRRQWTSTQLVAAGVKHPPLFAPGAKWSYSNTNYAALGAVLEKVTGQSLGELIEERIARPLHLKHTYLAADATWRGRHAHGYELDAAHLPPGVLPPGAPWVVGPAHDNHVDVTGISPSWGGAAGAVVSTAEDWSRFYAALMSGKLLPPAQLKDMLTVVPTTDEDRKNGTGYGLGIGKISTPCGSAWAHRGGLPGYASMNVTDSTGRHTATLLTSSLISTGADVTPRAAAAYRALELTTICAMFGKPAPASPAQTPAH